MAATRNTTRKNVAETPGGSLRATLCSGNFKTSKKYTQDPYDDDEDTPLDCVTLNEKTMRYEVSKDSGFTNDDAILEALVMFFLFARLKYGWGLEKTCLKLSVCSIIPKSKASKSGKRKRDDDEENAQNGASLSDDGPTKLEDIWAEEIERLGVRKQLNWNDNYDAIRKIFPFLPHPASGSWRRRSFVGKKNKKQSVKSLLHVFVEQSAIQWALANREDDPYLSCAPSLILKICAQYPTNTIEFDGLSWHIQTVLFDAAKQDDGDDFYRLAVNALEATGTNWDDVVPEYKLHLERRKKKLAEEAAGGDTEAAKNAADKLRYLLGYLESLALEGFWSG
ncbi:MAG: hypothetical protein SGARI_000979 [Bacillariaceae sp.]